MEDLTGKRVGSSVLPTVGRNIKRLCILLTYLYIPLGGCANNSTMNPPPPILKLERTALTVNIQSELRLDKSPLTRQQQGRAYVEGNGMTSKKGNTLLQGVKTISDLALTKHTSIRKNGTSRNLVSKEPTPPKTPGS